MFGAVAYVLSPGSFRIELAIPFQTVTQYPPMLDNQWRVAMEWP